MFHASLSVPEPQDQMTPLHTNLYLYWGWFLRRGPDIILQTLKYNITFSHYIQSPDFWMDCPLSAALLLIISVL